jgi:catechol 2,3-dioxygenase-like lactoylglutathione lyase family enzyme
MRLGGAMIFVKDLKRMAAFYTNTLGLKPIEETRLDNWVEFEGADARFSLHTIPEAMASQIQIASPPEHREKTPIKLSFEVEDAASEIQRLESLGVTVVRRPWGAADGIDPEGNIFGIHSKT